MSELVPVGHDQDRLSASGSEQLISNSLTVDRDLVSSKK